MAAKKKMVPELTTTPVDNEEDACGKAVYVALRNLVYFDQLFREDLTGEDKGNNRTHISERVESDNKKYGTKFPTGKQLINVKKMFISLGAVFRERGNDEPGEGSCYEYKDRNAILWLNEAIGQIRKDLNKKALKKKGKKQEGPQTSASTPHDVWHKLYIKQLMGLHRASDADYVGFNENMNLIGLEHFGELLEYIIDKKPMIISYIPFNNEPRRVKLFPYFLKNYNQRWFLIGRAYNENPSEKHPGHYYETLSCYALDRIKSLLTSDGTLLAEAIKEWQGVEWVENDVDIDDYYKNMIGVTDTGNIQETVLRFKKERYRYVATKKMLRCQEEVKPGEKYYDPERPTIRMQAMQNHELIQQILSFGADVEVIKPDALREQVRNVVREMMGNYEH